MAHDLASESSSQLIDGSVESVRLEFVGGTTAQTVIINTESQLDRFIRAKTRCRYREQSGFMLWEFVKDLLKQGPCDVDDGAG